MRILILFTTFFVTFSFQQTIGQERHLIPFEFKDQFDRVYTNLHYDQKMVVVISSDKGGSKYNPIWSQAILDAIDDLGVEDKVDLLGIANLKGVPFFLKGFIKGKLPKDPDNRLLLDWGGSFAKAYKFEEKMTNIAIFDQSGKLVLKTYGTELEHHKLKVMVDKLKELKNHKLSSQ